MAHYLLWMDHEHGKVFKYTPGKEDVSHIKNKHHQSHHTGNHEGEKKENQKKFWLDLEKAIADASHVLLVGPGLAKTEFKKYLETHHAKGLAQKIIGVETMDKASDGEIQNMARKYFHEFNLFH